MDGIRDAFRNAWLVVRCSFLGVWVGIVPGLGAQVVDWLSYGHAAQTCKGAKETFGKGDVRGVIAPEASNDAKDGGTLIPTLTLGVPGSLVSALFLFALTTMGFAPGPFMLERNADVIYSIVWVLGIASVIGGGLGLIFSNQLARLAELRYSIIVPSIRGLRADRRDERQPESPGPGDGGFLRLRRLLHEALRLSQAAADPGHDPRHHHGEVPLHLHTRATDSTGWGGPRCWFCSCSWPGPSAIPCGAGGSACHAGR